MHLFQQSAHAGLVLSNDDEQVFNEEPLEGQFVAEFDMRKPLPVRADFVLALHNEHAVISQDAKRFVSSAKVEV